MKGPRIAPPTRSVSPPPNGGPPPQVQDRVPASSATGGPKAKRDRKLPPLVLAGVVLILVALLGSWGTISASSKRMAVLVATHQLPAGTVLSGNDLRSAELGGDSSVLGSIVPERELPQTIGRRLSSPVSAGSPLASAALAAPASQTATMTLAVPEFDVIGPSLQAGESVGVLATFGAGTGQASARVVARGLRVVSVGEASQNADPSTSTVPVTVALTSQSIASALALADEDAKLDLLLEGGGQASTAPIPQATQSVGR